MRKKSFGSYNLLSGKELLCIEIEKLITKWANCNKQNDKDKVQAQWNKGDRHMLSERFISYPHVISILGIKGPHPVNYGT